MFLSALGFYANSNVIVAIGLDRLKVVYTSHVQGATSVRRVQNLISGSWALAIICSLPQLFFWDAIHVKNGNYIQCSAFMSTPMEELLRWWPGLPITYELLHQAAVFWIPFTIIFFSYLLIVIRLLHYTFTPKKVVRSSKSSHSDVSCRQAVSYNPLRVPSSCDHLIVESIALDKVEVSKGPLGSWLSVSTSTPNFKKSSTASDPGPRAIQQSKQRFCARLKGFSTFTRTGSLPIWRRQIRSRIFITALAVVAAHCMMWLPYNLINTLRFAK
ncbi:unnamed protein product, partial [Mesorhabditis belari]|uniref:G-protein coupled receptors family 1 profile domain-containing protein n=1 Tax=Mesorhabditis belari TaxID=2138241 RepID=A0AAF3FJK3_9BILA